MAYNSSHTGAQHDGYVTKTEIINLIYPVGSIYTSVNSTSPATLFGGTWAQITGRFLLACDSTYTAGSTGGETAHTLTTSEMPSHRHDLYVYNDDFSNGGDAETDFNKKKTSPGFTYDVALGQNRWTYSQLTSVGSDVAHNNMPPYLAVYVWKRTA